jgi:hypothetical protein
LHDNGQLLDLEAAEQVVRRRRQLLGRRLEVRKEADIVVAAAVAVRENTLSPKLGFMASRCNQARRAALDTARLKHGKRKMTESERAEEREQCRQRGHSVATAEKCY